MGRMQDAKVEPVAVCVLCMEVKSGFSSNSDHMKCSNSGQDLFIINYSRILFES